jgi:hypothetical protein
MKTIEIKTSEAVLQQPIDIEILDKTYSVAPPSVATLIAASAAISKLPTVDKNSENIAVEALAVAEDCAAIGEVIAILVLGAKGLTETKRSWLGRKKETIDKKAILARELLENLSPKQLNELMNRILLQMDIAFFFGSLISLTEINLTRARKKTTASGQ